MPSETDLTHYVWETFIIPDPKALIEAIDDAATDGVISVAAAVMLIHRHRIMAHVEFDLFDVLAKHAAHPELIDEERQRLMLQRLLDVLSQTLKIEKTETRQ